MINGNSNNLKVYLVILIVLKKEIDFGGMNI
jgi:hypothetical protein